MAMPNVISEDFLRPKSVLEALLVLHGTPTSLGAIVSAGTSVNNSSTAAPFSTSGNGLKGKTLLLYASAAGRILGLSSASDAVTATAGGALTGVPIEATTLRAFVMGASQPYLGFLPASGAATLEVWELT